MWAARSRHPDDVIDKDGHAADAPHVPPKLWSHAVHRLLGLRTNHWHKAREHHHHHHNPLGNPSLLDVSHSPAGPNAIHRHQLQLQLPPFPARPRPRSPIHPRPHTPSPTQPRPHTPSPTKPEPRPHTRSPTKPEPRPRPPSPSPTQPRHRHQPSSPPRHSEPANVVVHRENLTPASSPAPRGHSSPASRATSSSPTLHRSSSPTHRRPPSPTHRRPPSPTHRNPSFPSSPPPASVLCQYPSYTTLQPEEDLCISGPPSDKSQSLEVIQSSPSQCGLELQGALRYKRSPSPANQLQKPRELRQLSPQTTARLSTTNSSNFVLNEQSIHHNHIKSSSPTTATRSNRKGLTSFETFRASSSSPCTLASSKHRGHNGKKENYPERYSPYSTWKEENVLPVPRGLIKETNTKALERLVKQGVDSYINDLKNPSSSYKYFKPIKPTPIVSGGSLYHYKPSNLGKQDLEAWMKKQQQKKDSKSSYNLAFGRGKSIRFSHLQEDRLGPMTSPNDPEKQRTKKSRNFLKSVRGKMNARREVLNAIYGYHINSQARAQLERRACEFEREKKERMQQKVDFGNQATIKRMGRRRGRIMLEIPLNH